ncbi:MAG: hypothetical protein HY077_15345 [Elusimicrobia bacterium]|nr:hypothetical protein [Elusimicrobiota bacterium]
MLVHNTIDPATGRSVVIAGATIEKVVTLGDGPIEGLLRGETSLENALSKLDVAIAVYDKLHIETIKIAYTNTFPNGEKALSKLEGGFSVGAVGGELPAQGVINGREVRGIGFRCSKMKDQ